MAPHRQNAAFIPKPRSRVYATRPKPKTHTLTLLGAVSRPQSHGSKGLQRHASQYGNCKKAKKGLKKAKNAPKRAKTALLQAGKQAANPHKQGVSGLYATAGAQKQPKNVRFTTVLQRFWGGLSGKTPLSKKGL